MWYIVSVATAIVILAIGEMFENETKDEYVKRGYNWSKVIIYSNLSAIIAGVVSIVIVKYTGLSSEWNPILLPFATTISAYVTVQSFMTDLRVLLINRKMLRAAYLSMYAISVYNIVTSELFRVNWIALTGFTVLLVLIFIFSSIGASDVRAIAVALPYVISIGGYNAILMFVATLLFVALAMGVRNVLRDRKRMSKFKQDNMEVYNKMNKVLFYKFARDLIKKEKTPEETATAVGPYMITPFLIFLFLFPFSI